MTDPPHRFLHSFMYELAVSFKQCDNMTIHTGIFHRKGYLMLNHLAGATIHVANLVSINCQQKQHSCDFIHF